MNIVDKYNRRPEFKYLKTGNTITILKIPKIIKSMSDLKENKQYIITDIDHINKHQPCIGCESNGWCIYIKTKETKYRSLCGCILGDRNGVKLI